MKRVVGLMALLISVLTVTPAVADFYVIAGGGRLGTAITTVPFPISSPGLYYLTVNLTSSNPNLYAIPVFADDVTIDLNGFCLTGPGKGSGSGNNGIRVAEGHTNVEIRNGSIKAFGNDGIQSQTACTGIRVVGVRVRDTETGINLQGSDNLVMDCTVRHGLSRELMLGLTPWSRATRWQEILMSVSLQVLDLRRWVIRREGIIGVFQLVMARR